MPKAEATRHKVAIRVLKISSAAFSAPKYGRQIDVQICFLVLLDPLATDVSLPNAEMFLHEGPST